ncbi:hypothetical protein [Nocardia pseudobrasiliensis]|uniref:Uncharacterized protein n=1 Tax=Nocardia pseudobrasiliensis TaxID=45979 RepID=A0A370IA57_9NOCA|nr:hypothetical protein [Nocardia pseudobrasiliensis]RDI67626.1 hypothetical protein DFR76_10223 [Nocardia pseudobrasiliensis]
MGAHRGAAESQTSALVDLTLVVTTAIAYVLCRAWYGWYGFDLRARVRREEEQRTG